MRLSQIKEALDDNRAVYWSNKGYVVKKDEITDEYIILCEMNNSVIGLTYQDGITMNGHESEFFMDDFLILESKIPDTEDVQMSTDRKRLFSKRDAMTKILNIHYEAKANINETLKEVKLNGFSVLEIAEIHKMIMEQVEIDDAFSDILVEEEEKNA